MSRAVLLLTLATLAAACDRSGPSAKVDAEGPSAAAASAATLLSAPVAVRAAGRDMPPRPVPTSSPTVTIGMPQEVQLQAISYMQAMQAPQPSDASADPGYAKQVADSLRGTGNVDVVSSGRRIEVKLPKGCDATFPKSAVGRSSAGSLSILLANGVLVVGCMDRSVECWQSTRDANDVLCVHR